MDDLKRSFQNVQEPSGCCRVKTHTHPDIGFAVEAQSFWLEGRLSFA